MTTDLVMIAIVVGLVIIAVINISACAMSSRISRQEEEE